MHREASWLPVDQHMRMFDAHRIRASWLTIAPDRFTRRHRRHVDAASAFMMISPCSIAQQPICFPMLAIPRLARKALQSERQQASTSRRNDMARLLSIDIPVSHGALEGLLRLPDDEAAQPTMVAVVCHPHPAHGGTMHNKVVFRVAQALGDLGIPALRFNFRGVGRSTGAYDQGNGERDDVRAAVDEIARRFPGISICMAGFSFGSWIGLPVGCADNRVRQLIGAGIPTSLLTTDALAECGKPKLIVQGE